MKYSTRVSDAAHILVMIALSEDQTLTSDQAAKSINTHPACVRQLMSQLRNQGIIHSVKGHPRPALAKPPEEITLLDIYKAVERDKPLLHLNTHTNPACGIGMNIQYALQDHYDHIQSAAEAAMAECSLADVIKGYQRRIKLL